MVTDSTQQGATAPPNLFAPTEPRNEGGERTLHGPNPETTLVLGGLSDILRDFRQERLRKLEGADAFYKGLGAVALEHAQQAGQDDDSNRSRHQFPPARNAWQRYKQRRVADRAETLKSAQEQQVRLKEGGEFLRAVRYKTEVTPEWRKAQQRQTEYQLSRGEISIFEYRERMAELKHMKGKAHKHSRELAEGEEFPLVETKHTKQLAKSVSESRRYIQRLSTGYLAELRKSRIGRLRKKLS